jgi:hypothetical protein
VVESWLTFGERKPVVLLHKFATAVRAVEMIQSKHSLIPQRTLRRLPGFRGGARGVQHHYSIDLRHRFPRSLGHVAL